MSDSLIDYFKNNKPTDPNLDFHLSKIKIVEEFLIKYNLPRDNFSKNKKDVYLKKNIEQDDSTEYSSTYNPTTNNIVYINEDDIIHELFHMASSNRKDKSTGITRNINGKKVDVGLDEGITDMFASFVDKNMKIQHILEEISAEILFKTFGIQVFYGYFNNSYEEFISSFSGQVKYNIEYLLELLDEYHFLKFYIYRTESTSELEKLHELSYDIVANFFDLYEVLNLDKNDLMELIQNLFSRVSEDDQNFLGINKITLDDFCNDFGI